MTLPVFKLCTDGLDLVELRDVIARLNKLGYPGGDWSDFLATGTRWLFTDRGPVVNGYRGGGHASIQYMPEVPLETFYELTS